MTSTIKTYFSKFIRKENLRVPVKKSIVNLVRKEMKLLRNTKVKRLNVSIKKKTLYKSFVWSDNLGKGASIGIDLPILRKEGRNTIDLKKVKVPRKAPKRFLDIDRGCIVVDENNILMAVFVTEKEDPRIKELNKYTAELFHLIMMVSNL